MIKVTSSILTFFILSSLALASDNTPIYDNDYVVKTKEVMMLSQLMSDGHNLNIDVTGSVTGKRGFLSSLSENNDASWRGWVQINTVINNCFNEEAVQANAKAGYIFKSRIADGTVTAIRESAKQLKNNGAKYIFIGSQMSPSSQGYTKNINNENSIQVNQSFADYFQSILTKDIQLNDIKQGSIQGSGISISRSTDNRCFQDNSFKASDVFWVVGQVAALAIGVKGASAGNTNMTSLAAHSSNAVENTASLASANGNISNDKMLSGIANKVSVSMFGVVDPLYFSKNEPKMQYIGHIFPISEVEEHLAHYKVIPYNVKKITSN